ncbi:MAG: AAA family ATPase [Acidimicrobiia bacterium]|nr:AAA family ATPase [Acidimicrobiia bacterium]
MDQKLALEIMLSGESVLLTGSAGSGKTYILNQFIKSSRAEGKNVSVTATTGLAATHLNGNTIHSWAGIGINNSLHKNFFDNLLKGRRDTIKNTDVLIIDEISMLHDYRLDMIEMVTRTVRENDKPFGGIQLILCGDFFQLPPVSRSDEPDSSFVVNSQSFKELDPVICYLDEQHRQDDGEFLDILNAIRSGDVRKRHAGLLMTRQDAELDEDEVTELHTVNVNVDAINSKKLKELPGEEHNFQTVTTGKENYVETLKRSCLALDELILKKDALVMCIKNSNEKKYVNGSLGIIIDFEDGTGYPIVKLHNGKILTIAPDTWELHDGDKKRAGLEQIPLRLAWAITVHKSQGMTLDSARIDLRKTFVPGMGYVALSRVRNLESLSLMGANRMAFAVSEEALMIEETLQNQTKADEKRFVHLLEVAKKRKPIEDEKKKKSDSGWNEKLTKMRDTYPNAYKKWTKADDALLQKLFGENRDIAIKTLSDKLGRHEGSIRIRIEKLFEPNADQSLT